MPKVRGPLFSLNAAGTLGKALTYKKGVFGNVVRKYRKEKTGRSAGQSTVRVWFQRGVWTWQGVSDRHGYYYSTLCYGLQEPARKAFREYRSTNSLHGYYLFMKYFISKSLLGLPQIQVAPNIGFCVADEWRADYLIANGFHHDWS